MQVLYCMIIAEYHISRNFEHIENELVSKLDTLFMSDSKNNEISRAFFIGHLRHLFDSSDVDEDLRTRVTHFLDSVDVFLSTSDAYINPDGDSVLIRVQVDWQQSSRLSRLRKPRPERVSEGRSQRDTGLQ